MSEQELIQRARPVEAPPAAAVTPMQMLQLAMERGADMDRLQQLMDLQQRWEANEARKAFVAAMAAFKANPPEILKAKLVSFTKKDGNVTEYYHATLADVCAAATKGLAQVGISHRWDVKQDSGKITVTCMLTHSMGHSESVSLTSLADDSGGKNAIQAMSSAVSYLERYTLLAITGLSARDMDDDGRGAEETEVITDEQANELRKLAEEVGADMAKFCAYLKVGKLEDLPAAGYKKAKAGLEAKGAKS